MNLSLQNLYELRKSHSDTPRNGHARVFHFANKFGLWDASGVLFPVEGIEEFDGKSVSFLGSFTGHFKPSKYLDNGFYFKVTDVTQINSGGKAPKFDFSVTSIPDHSHFYRNEVFQKMRLVAERSRYIGRTIAFFENRGFLNIDAPILVSSGGIECHMESFRTQYTDHRGQIIQMELPTSPEMSLKKILAKGVPKVFSIAKSFRNHGELAKWHEPEFLMLEWYRVGGTLESLMSETMDFVVALLEQMEHSQLLEKAKLEWPVFCMRDLFLQHVGLDLDLMQDVGHFYSQAKPLSMDIRESDDWGTIYFKLLFRYVEPVLVTYPLCFVRDFPIQLGALAATDGNHVKRFELYMSGIEMCNGYVELTDPNEYQERLQQARIFRPHLAQDAEFDSVMSTGLPPSVGNAVGLDRLIAYLMSTHTISSALPLPFLRRFPTAAKD